MTYIDRDHELRESATSCIFDELELATILELAEPYAAELQSGKSIELIGVRKIDDETIFFVTSTGEIPTMRLELESLMNFVDTRIMTKQFSLK